MVTSPLGVYPADPCSFDPPASSNPHTLIMFNLEDPSKRLEGKRHSAQTMVEWVLISLYTPGNLNDHFLLLCKRKSQHEWKLLM